MKKIILVVMTLALTLVFSGSAIAGSMHCINNNCEYKGEYGGGWSYDCQNDSCVMIKGIIRVGYNRLDFNRPGVSISGISGLPLRVEDFVNVESKVIELFPSINDLGGAEELMKGRRINIDHTLRFINWMAKTDIDMARYNNDKGGVAKDVELGIIFLTIDKIMELYSSGDIFPYIETYFLSQKIEDIKKIDYLDEKANKRLLFIKWFIDTMVNSFRPTDTTQKEILYNDTGDMFVVIDTLYKADAGNEKAKDKVKSLYNEFQGFLIEKRQRPQAEKYFIQGNELLKAGNYRDAINMFDKVLAIFPDNKNVKENRLIAETSLKTEEDTKAKAKVEANLKAEEEAKAKAKKTPKTPKKKPVPVSNPKPKNGGVK